jgi:hypothetical protein
MPFTIYGNSINFVPCVSDRRVTIAIEVRSLRTFKGHAIRINETYSAQDLSFVSRTYKNYENWYIASCVDMWLLT